MTLSNANNNQLTKVNHTLGVRLKTVNLSSFLSNTEVKATHSMQKTLQMLVLKNYTNCLPTCTSTRREQVLKCMQKTSSYQPNQRTRAGTTTILRKQQNKTNTKHCEQLKQAALQIPLAGSCSSGNIGCCAVRIANTIHTTKTQHEIYFR